MAAITTLPEAVAAHVHDGDVVALEGFTHLIPHAAGHEIVRQGRRDLTLCRSGADILFDMMIGAGCVKKVVFGYVGNPGIGLAHAFRRAVEAGTLAVEDWTNFGMVLRLHAGAMGVPFLPAATLRGRDMPNDLPVKSITCPYTGEEMTAVPALRPDVALIHAQYADEEGNIQLFGLSGDTVDGALASHRIVATVEEIVPASFIRRQPDRTIVPGFRVASVSQVKWGAHPSYVDGFYSRDDDAYTEWDKMSRKAEQLTAWIDKNVKGVSDFSGYLNNIDQTRLVALAAAKRNIGV